MVQGGNPGKKTPRESTERNKPLGGKRRGKLIRLRATGREKGQPKQISMQLPASQEKGREQNPEALKEQIYNRGINLVTKRRGQNYDLK